MGEYPSLTQVREEEDQNESRISEAPLRVIVCMLKENSHRFLNEKYIQSDIGFKRIVGWKEFELGARDSITRISEYQIVIYVCAINPGV